jgi:hypothetical protein
MELPTWPRSVGPFVFVEELGDSVGGDSGFMREHVSGDGRHGEASDGVAEGVPGIRGSADGPGLAGTGGPDEADDRVAPQREAFDSVGLVVSEPVCRDRFFHVVGAGDPAARVATVHRRVEDVLLQREGQVGGVAGVVVGFVHRAAVTPVEPGRRWDRFTGETDDLVVRDHLVGEVLDPDSRFVGVVGEAGREADGNLLDNVSAIPGRVLLLEVGEHVVVDRAWLGLLDARLVMEDAVEPVVDGEAGGLGVQPPEVVDVGGQGLIATLRLAGVERGPLVDVTPLRIGQGAPQLGLALADLARCGTLDGAAALRPEIEQSVGDTSNVGLAVVVDRAPLDPESCGCLGAQRGVVHGPGRLELRVHASRVDGTPDAVGAPDPVRDK